jgi:hypothetical protein
MNRKENFIKAHGKLEKLEDKTAIEKLYCD